MKAIITNEVNQFFLDIYGDTIYIKDDIVYAHVFEDGNFVRQYSLQNMKTLYRLNHGDRVELEYD